MVLNVVVELSGQVHTPNRYVLTSSNFGDENVVDSSMNFLSPTLQKSNVCLSPLVLSGSLLLITYPYS
jgi:hypothetical protein